MSYSVQSHRRQPTRLPCPWLSPGKNTGVGCHFLLQCMKVKSESEVAQLCLTLSDPMDCSLPGYSVHGIFQARILEWGTIVFPILLFSSISLHWSLKKAFLSLLAILRNSAFRCYIFPFLLCFSPLFFSQLFVRPPQTAILLFCIFFPWGWSWSLSPVQCHEPLSIVHQALYLSDLVP